MISKKYWLLFEKSDDTRISKGIDGYRDETGEIYRYDSKVPNHKKLSLGDVIVLRKENEILGLGRIENIVSVAAVKKHRRCSKCESTDIRERITLSPTWKCGKCTHEFAEPINTNMSVLAYTATISDFTLFINSPSFREVKACALAQKGSASQLSILQLDEEKINTLLKDIKSFPVAH